MVWYLEKCFGGNGALWNLDISKYSKTAPATRSSGFALQFLWSAYVTRFLPPKLSNPYCRGQRLTKSLCVLGSSSRLWVATLLPSWDHPETSIMRIWCLEDCWRGTDSYVSQHQRQMSNERAGRAYGNPSSLGICFWNIAGRSYGTFWISLWPSVLAIITKLSPLLTPLLAGLDKKYRVSRGKAFIQHEEKLVWKKQGWSTKTGTSYHEKQFLREKDRLLALATRPRCIS